LVINFVYLFLLHTFCEEDILDKGNDNKRTVESKGPDVELKVLQGSL